MAILLFVSAFVYTKIFKVIRNRLRPGSPDRNNVGTAEQSSFNRQSNRNFLMDIRLPKSCYLSVVCFLLCFLAGIVTSLPFSLSIFSREVFRSWAATLVILNSTINSLIFFWNSSLLRNETEKALKNLCKPAH